MANFIMNSTNTKAVRKTQISTAEIMQIDDIYVLLITLANDRHMDIKFETDETEEGINSKAADFLTALEE